MNSVLRYISKNVPAVRAARHALHLARARLAQRTLHAREINEKLVVFQAYNGRFACSPRAIYDAMRRDPRFAAYRFVWVVDDEDEYPFLTSQEPRTTLVTYRSPAYFEAFESAKFWIVNSLVSTRILKAPGQVMLQCWHGTPLKRLRNDIVSTTQGAMNSVKDYRRKNILDVSRFDHFISPSTFASQAFSSAFELGELGKAGVIREIGYPRNDALVNHTSDDVRAARRKLGISPERRVLLYTPTWRDDAHSSTSGYLHHNQLDLDALRARLGDDYLVLYRAHYMITNSIEFGRHAGFVKDVSHVDDINDLYLASDALITDYSSTMFDFANLERPIFFYMYDRESYENDLRGFYLDLNELPGSIFTEMAPLCDALADPAGYFEEYRLEFKLFSQRFNPWDDGKAAQRALDLLVEPRPTVATTLHPAVGVRKTDPAQRRKHSTRSVQRDDIASANAASFASDSKGSPG
ncbi:CDP-glycerol glycerophosphotransferase family protein [Micrococcales bacterium 31B]|nr:CDP-glycerol glycerophosphotransferase family protein [Micrococcales bacterium 31B]